MLAGRRFSVVAPAAGCLLVSPQAAQVVECVVGGLDVGGAARARMPSGAWICARAWRRGAVLRPSVPRVRLSQRETETHAALPKLIANETGLTSHDSRACWGHVLGRMIGSRAEIVGHVLRSTTRAWSTVMHAKSMVA